jgi:very-short-patch-repair endonuclease
VDAVEELLARSGRIARRRDLLAAGLSRRALQRRVREGALRPLTPHLFTDVAEPSPDEALRAAAVALDAVVSHTSAALLWGLELASTPERPTVTVGRDRSRAAMGGVVVRRTDLADGDWLRRDGVRLTTVLRTVLDLCRTLPLAEAVACADSAVRQGLLRLSDLRRALCALPAGRGRSMVARVLALVDPRCGSVLESLLRVLLHVHGVRPPRTQVTIRARDGRLVGRVDFAWSDVGLVVEADGFAFHADRRAYRDDRRRSNVLVLDGWRVLRFSWEDVVQHPEDVVAAVRAALAVQPSWVQERTAAHTS